MRWLYWFQNDLRLEDNPGLRLACSARELLLVFFWPVNRPWCNVTGLGAQRERFLGESVQALQQALEERGQSLLVLRGMPEQTLPELVRDYGIERVLTPRSPGYYERKTLEVLAKRLPVPLDTCPGNTLFRESQLPVALSDLPVQFTPFRHRVEDLACDPPLASPGTLPPSPVRGQRLQEGGTAPHSGLPIRGGAEAGHRRLRQFVFEEQSILSYKATRNTLDPLGGSSTLSPWLANGSLSAREVAAAIRTFEARHARNESTYWLYFELLWREFFHWRALRDDVSLFRLRGSDGRRKRLQLCTFEPRAFARWCEGDTDYPLVNACMRQLVATGWMSNRGRQIAASCLVNELGLDWRYGAAFFEKHLIDYDVASNYGNWQYLAGAGADPRGGRHFDIDKQTRTHDPEGTFTAKWGGYRPPQPRYVVDAADWPLDDR